MFTMKLPMLIHQVFKAPNRLSGRHRDNILVNIIRDVSRMNGFTFAEFTYYLDIYQQTRSAFILRTVNEQEEAKHQLQALKDYCDSIRFCLEGFHCQSTEELCQEITGLFSHQKPIHA